MREISVDELWNSGKYSLLKTLKYQEIVEFVFQNIRHKNPATRWYFGYNLVTLIILATFCIYVHYSGNLNLKFIFKYFLWGLMAGSFLVIPVHEIIHGISYLIQGAPKIFFGADFRQMIFYVSSDKYVISRRDFYLVALSPFIIINLFVLILIFFVDMEIVIFLISFALFHNIMCIGDFAMVSYFSHHKDKELYTYDDHKERTSYIFEKGGNGNFT
jgi:hypothetical protein